jgi:predicted ATPase/class 3 adenylate cyclase/DNA-binding CsgD family transcriptional regulator
MEATQLSKDSLLPLGTVTLVMTDIEGSSKAWEMDPAATRAAVGRLDEMLSEIISRHGGERPAEQGEGDSAVAAFARPSDALACALDLQLAIQKEQWPEGAELRLRIALHTGEVEHQDGNRYAGATLNRCARLRDIAHGGQTLLSGSTYELVRDQPPADTELADRGLHHLKDLGRPEHVYELRHVELPSGFPALRSLGALPTNLPIQLTSFIGRRRELAAIKELLKETRLLTLTGSGGCGKTRLALQVAADELESFPDGVWWVDLSPLAESDLVASTVASVLGLQEVPLQSFEDRLQTNLHEKNMLLILDNGEHLVDACAQLVDRLLHGCPHLKVIVTSREPLGAVGETAWRVPSLSLPSEPSSQPVAALSQFDAVHLFIDRAVKARPNFRVTNENAPAVAEICQRLDGIPLAIELAAARTRLLSPDQIVQGLIDRFRLLAGGARTAVPRQQTLLASVEWSHRLLNDAERMLLRRLAVFAGSFTLDATEAVCSDESLSSPGILDVLGSLVDKSLVQVEEQWLPTRYRLLETIRQYASDKLIDSDEAPSARDAHLDYYVRLADDARVGLEGGSDQMSWLELLDLEQDNLRAAMEWARSAEPEKGMRIARGLWGYWYARGEWSEGSMRSEVTASSTDGSPAWRAKVLAAGAVLATTGLELGRARLLGEEAVSIARSIGDEVALLEALYAHASPYFFSDPKTARPLVLEATELARQRGDAFWYMRTLYGLGVTECNSGNFDAARPLIEECVELHNKANNRLTLYLPLYWLVLTALSQGDLDDARKWVTEALSVSRELRNFQIEAVTLSLAAMIAALSGEHAEAGSTFDEARMLIGKHPHPLSSAVLPLFDDYLGYARGDLPPTSRAWQEGIAFFEVSGVKWMAAWLLSLRADIAIARGDVAEAESLVTRAAELATTSENSCSIGRALRTQGNLLRARGDIDAAEDLYHQALRAFAESGAKPDVVVVLESLAGAAAREESWTEAARLFGATDQLRDVLGCERFVTDIAEYEKDVSLARENLDPGGFERAWREGAAMSMEQAIAYAERGRGERKRPSSGWKSLTPVEIDVVRLVAEGLTNPEIGKRLFISSGTVKNHLSHVFAKLGIATRSELAAEATRRQLAGR